MERFKYYILLIEQEKVRQGINWTSASAAARVEVLFLGHMAAAHSAAMQLLESEGEARHLAERTRRTAFLTSAREALGVQLFAPIKPIASAYTCHSNQDQPWFLAFILNGCMSHHEDRSSSEDHTDSSGVCKSHKVYQARCIFLYWNIVCEPRGTLCMKPGFFSGHC